MPRRFHIPALTNGIVSLDATQSRHARDVLRLEVGTLIELFDDAGRSTVAPIVSTDDTVTVRVTQIMEPPESVTRIVVVAAVPKGNRADWMVEKLAEIGVAAFVPLAAARSVVLPEGRGKSDRWQRIAAEAAKQSQSPGVMTIKPLTDVATVVTELAGQPAWCLSTEAGSVPVATAIAEMTAAPPPATLTLLIGPEGGWTDAELAAFAAEGVRAVRLTRTVLRVETAALAAATVAVVLVARRV
jgi:16S rRNA (uracil1498-N3)-methyltransferase